MMGCQGPSTPLSSPSGSLSVPDDLIEPDPGDEPQPGPDPISEDLEICSDLNYEGVTWAERLSFDDRQALLLALNISGSYEGHSGWSNLTNNFDNQGLSMGLLNQTLGTGSLQPLLFKFRKNSPSSYQAVLPSSLRRAMDQMLDAWGAAKGLSAQSLAPIEPSLAEVDRNWIGHIATQIDPLNVDKFYAYPDMIRAYDAATDASVRWALNTIYTSSSGRTFKSEWKTALKNLASHPDYISLQIEAAHRLHDRALDYQVRLGFDELRGYLMLFDIAVQNGSLRQSHFNSFFSWRASNPNATPEQQMIRLVDIRAASSLPQYQEDVKSRKKTIVRGTGFVHGANRNLPQEYCYSPLKTYPIEANLP